MTWIGKIMANRTADGEALSALAAELAGDDGTPPALRELARAYGSRSLYRADRPRARSGDPETSQAAARRVAGRARPDGAVHRLLIAYSLAAAWNGYTSLEVEGVAQVRAAHKRTSELIYDGLLRVVEREDGTEATRDGSRILEITRDGLVELDRLDRAKAAKEAAR